MKIFQSLRFQHFQHVRKLAARNLKRQAEGWRVISLEQRTRVGALGLHRRRRHDHDEARPREARLRHRKKGWHDHVGKLDRLTRRPGLNLLPEAYSAAADYLSLPMTGFNLWECGSFFLLSRGIHR